MRVKDAKQLDQIRELFELSIKETIEHAERYGENSICDLTQRMTSQVMLAANTTEFTKFALSYVR